MPLTSLEIRQISPQKSDIWLSDEKGLRLLIKPNGAKYWRMKYRFEGKQKTLALGVYPEISLKDARIARDKARLQMAEGFDPMAEKQIAKKQSLLGDDQKFSVLALQWYEHQKGTWDERHASRLWNRLESNTFVELNRLPLENIRPHDVLAVIRKIESRGALDVAARCLQDVRRVFRYGVQTGRLLHNPAADLTGVIKTYQSKHRASLPIDELGQFMCDLRQYKTRGRLLTQLAIEMLILTFAPAARRVRFSVPRLITEIQGELEFADPEVFDEFHDWSLLDYPAKLDESSFRIRDEAHTFEIDLDGRKLEISYASQDEQLSLDINVEGWNENNLALALDKLIADPRFSQSERLKWCLAQVHYLVETRKITLSALWRAKFILARKLTELIREMKMKEAQKAYQKNLFAPEAKPDISFNHPLEFKDGMYEGQKPYRGRFKFKKHFLEVVPEIDGGDGGEEFQCAMALESLPEVKHWLRNIAKHPASFRLPLAQGWTYPDFIAELNDGRFLVVEYKGAHLLNDAETREKRFIGELWEKQMMGKGLYIMAVKDDQGKDVRAQLIDKVEL